MKMGTRPIAVLVYLLLGLASPVAAAQTASPAGELRIVAVSEAGEVAVFTGAMVRAAKPNGARTQRASRRGSDDC